MDVRLCRRCRGQSRVSVMKVSLPAIFGALLFGFTGTLATAWAVVSIGRGHYLSVLVVFGFALMCLGFSVPLLKVIPGRVSPRAEWNELGTTFRPDRGIEVPAIMGTFAGVIAGALFAILFPLGRIDVPVPDGLRFLLPFISAMLAVVGLPILWQVTRSGGIYRLQMGPDGFVVNAGGKRPQSGVWAQVVDVTDTVPGRTAADDPNSVVIVLADDSVIKLPAASFTPDALALRRLVHFYWQHKSNRDELTDGRALERLRTENFRSDS